jgi:hypothetical protein
MARKVSTCYTIGQSITLGLLVLNRAVLRLAGMLLNVTTALLKLIV